MKKSTGRQSGIGAYSQLSLETDIIDASPHRLVQMLIDAALKKLLATKVLIENKQIAEKGKQIGLVISIIDSLKASLDKSKGGLIAENLEALYEYILQRLTHANIHNDTAIIDEVIKLLSPIKEAWDAIPEEVRQQHQQYQQELDSQASPSDKQAAAS